MCQTSPPPSKARQFHGPVAIGIPASSQIRPPGNSGEKTFQFLAALQPEFENPQIFLPASEGSAQLLKVFLVSLVKAVCSRLKGGHSCVPKTSDHALKLWQDSFFPKRFSNFLGQTIPPIASKKSPDREPRHNR